ncbi:MAG TPA: class I SAM-dependent methyltransferase [Solirubrobacteraceae bacterium]|jgi:SAM-dependent methyltransferase|nr:class I SAM-dependent methyltransferase [Solirubrobacteraceae bacterium]
MTEPITLEMVKKAQQYMWSEGDFATMATAIVIVGELLCEAIDVMPGDRVVDVACGSGTAALAAARRGGVVTGVDYVPALLDRGRERAAAERLVVDWLEGDAEDLPLADASCDIVLSTFGAMFAPDHARAAGELLRVCRPGGRIGMANWLPDSLVGELFATIVKHAPPPIPIDPPGLWGVQAHLEALFGDEITGLEVTPREFVMRAPSPELWVAFFRANFGPLTVAFARVGEDGEQALTADLLDLITRRNRCEDGRVAAPGTYLEVVAHRR